MTQGRGAEAARSFGPAADLYDRARAGYDEAAVRFAGRGSDTLLVRYRTTAIRACRAVPTPSPERP